MVDLVPGETVIRSEVVRVWNSARQGVLTLTDRRMVFEVPRTLKVEGVNLLPLIEKARGVPIPMRTLLEVPREELTVHQVAKPLFGNARWLRVGSPRHQGEFVVGDLDGWLSAVAADPSGPMGSSPSSPPSMEWSPSDSGQLAASDSDPGAGGGSAPGPPEPYAGAKCPLCGSGLVRTADGDLSCPMCRPPG
ncbi:MAG TPA: hypothetical protein VGS23_02775 [Thermoplasmata archaeon]|nr:hypothetical protein [Thermoplasmata archaeon]